MKQRKNGDECPQCGVGKLKVELENHPEGTGIYWYSYACPRCGFEYIDNYGGTIEEAVIAWRECYNPPAEFRKAWIKHMLNCRDCGKPFAFDLQYPYAVVCDDCCNLKDDEICFDNLCLGEGSVECWIAKKGHLPPHYWEGEINGAKVRIEWSR